MRASPLLFTLDPLIYHPLETDYGVRNLEEPGLAHTDDRTAEALDDELREGDWAIGEGGGLHGVSGGWGEE